MPSRRDAAIAALVGGAGIAAGYYLLGKKAPVAEDDIELQLPSAPLTQDVVDKQYVELYTHLKNAKDAADKAQKPLIILAAEVHNNRNSLIADLMITDIASRLGIEDALIEQDGPGVRGIDAKARTRMDRMEKGPVRIKTDGMGKDEAAFVNISQMIPDLSAQPHKKIFRLQQKIEMPNDFIAMMQGKYLGMRFHGADPLHMERKKVTPTDGGAMDEKLVFDPKFEIAMVKAVADIAQEKKKSCVAILGAVHVPEMQRQLEAAGALVTAVDCSAGVSKLPNAQDYPIMAKRFEDVAQMYAPQLASRQHVVPHDALAMTLKASAKHKLAAQEINGDDAKKRVGLVETLQQHVAGKSR